MNDDLIDAIYARMTEQGLLQTRVNKKTKEQELAITDFGQEFYEVLGIFANKENTK